MVGVAERLRRQVVALETEGSNPSVHPYTPLDVITSASNQSTSRAFGPFNNYHNPLYLCPCNAGDAKGGSTTV